MRTKASLEASPYLLLLLTLGLLLFRNRVNSESTWTQRLLELRKGAFRNAAPSGVFFAFATSLIYDYTTVTARQLTFYL